MIVNTKQRATIRVNNQFAVLVSFAALYPPLAVIALVSICVHTYFEERNTARLLRHANMYKKEWLAERMERESVGITNSYPYTTALMVTLGSWLFACFVFDALGEQSGWRLALYVALTVICVPLFIWLGWFIFRQLFMRGNTEKNEPIAVEMPMWRDSTIPGGVTRIDFVNPLLFAVKR